MAEVTTLDASSQPWSEPSEPSAAEAILPVRPAPSGPETPDAAPAERSTNANPPEQEDSADNLPTREEVYQQAQALQESLATLFNQIEAVKEEHDKLYNHNKFLQQYIGDLMSTSKITATSSSRAKK